MLRREAWGFVLGSLLFAIAAVPGYARFVGVDADNLTYFVGSLFFTGAGFVALRMSGRPAPNSESEKVELYDWWAAAVQFGGTLLFNVSTGIAMVTGLTSSEADKWVWRPDIFGSAAFLVASALAVVATTETDKLWDPHARDWRSTWLNMIGSIAFAVSAVGAFVRPSTGRLADAELANLGTFVGALCFMAAALLMRPLGRVINNC